MKMSYGNRRPNSYLTFTSLYFLCRCRVKIQQSVVAVNDDLTKHCYFRLNSSVVYVNVLKRAQSGCLKGRYTREHGPWTRVTKRHPWPVNTAREAVNTGSVYRREHGPCRKKHCRAMLFSSCKRPVHTTRVHGPWTRVSFCHRCSRPVNTGSVYRP